MEINSRFLFWRIIIYDNISNFLTGNDAEIFFCIMIASQ